ncbi:alpha/beta hydrolase family protein [Sinomicrobium sp. M5D2P17]
MDSRELPTPAGYTIVAKEFACAAHPKGVVVIVPATGVKQSYYYKFAGFLRNKGYTTFTFDYGGIGASRKGPLQNFRTSATAWAKNDIEEVIRFAGKKYPEVKLTLIGHSIGGQLIGLAPSSVLADRILLVAAQNGYWKFWKGAGRLRMLLNWYFLFPVITKIFGYFPGKKLGVMEDLPEGMVREWRKWCVTPDYLFGYYEEEALFFHKFRGKLFVYSIEDDRFAPEEAVHWLSRKYANTGMEKRHLIPADFGLEKIGHFGVFKSKNKSHFWNLLLRDIENGEK